MITVISARYARADNSSLFVETGEDGLVEAFEGDAYWAAALKAKVQIGAFEPPPKPLRIVAARKVLQAAASAGVLGALDAAAAAAKDSKPGDWLYYSREPDWAEVNPKLSRIAKAANVALAPLFDAAVSL